MLKSWQTNTDYRTFLHNYRMSLPDDSARNYYNKLHRNDMKAMYRLDIDAAMEYLKPLYPDFGRPAVCQSQIIRTFVLMLRINVLSIDKMVSLLRCSPNLAAIAGLTPSNVPPVGSFYDFISRLWTQDPSERHLGINDVLPCDRNANALDEVLKIALSGGLGDDGKLPDSNPSITKECERIIRSGESFPNSFGVHFQTLFRILGVKGSLSAGLLAPVKTISGDGTCFHVHANPNGHRRCDCLKRGITSCKCDRHFSDPDATWGYDSDLDKHFYGHTIYTLTAHNAEVHVDLPLHIRLTSARRHDSASGLISLHEYFSADPLASIENICLDSAHDNMPTYRLCIDTWHCNPLIDLNCKRGRKKHIQDSISIGPDGVPICHAGERMTYQGMDYTNNRIKFRCPLAAAGKSTSSCKCIGNCSSSNYGRCVYVKADSDIRLYPPIPRDSTQYKNIYKDRTSCERVNNRILNNYHLASYKGRSAMRVSFFTILAAINIHLDAQIKVLGSDEFEDMTA